MEILYAVVGIAIGAFIGILIVRNGKNELVTKVEVLQSQLDSAQKQQEEVKADAERQLSQAKSDFNQQLQKAKDEADARQKDALAAKDDDCQRLISSIEEHQKQAMQAQKEQFDETLAKMVAQTKTATEDMLKQRQKEFTESSSQGLGQIVDPLKETISKMKEAMDATSKEQNTLTATMQQRIEDLIQHSDAAKNSADELARVFKHSSKVQGDWGEVVLDELLESQGLTKGIHYHIQETLRDKAGDVIQSEEGKRMRPDVILHLDKTREVIIDSKVVDRIYGLRECRRRNNPSSSYESPYRKFAQTREGTFHQGLFFVHTGAQGENGLRDNVCPSYCRIVDCFERPAGLVAEGNGHECIYCRRADAVCRPENHKLDVDTNQTSRKSRKSV